MATMNRRCFIKTAAMVCPLIVGAGRIPAWARPRKDPPYTVIKEKCDGCGDCVEACPVEAIKIKDKLAVIDGEACIECDVCVDECPTEAIVKKENQDQGQATAPAGGVAGLWVFTGTFADGTSSEPETVRFFGTAAEGKIQSIATGEQQGTYRVNGAEIELRLSGDITAKGKIVSPDLMEGTMPGGKWKAERKKALSARPSPGSK